MRQKARKPFDLDSYIQTIQRSPCFICELVTGRLNGNHIIQRNDAFIIFLNKYPVLYGHVLVAPIQHREQVTGDFHLGEYLALQEAVYRTAEAVRKTIASERIYILSLGSQQGNAMSTGILLLCPLVCRSKSSSWKRYARKTAFSISRRMRWNGWPGAFVKLSSVRKWSRAKRSQKS
jgi:hypothetical protein